MTAAHSRSHARPCGTTPSCAMGSMGSRGLASVTPPLGPITPFGLARLLQWSRIMITYSRFAMFLVIFGNKI
jgi:hypothetical protein